MESFAVPAEGHPLPAILYTGHRILRGVFYQRTPMRLSDYINLQDEDFLALHNVQAFDLLTAREDAPSPEPWLLARGEILIIHETATGQETGTVRSGGDRVQKRPVAVRCCVGPFRVDGQYYMVDFANIASCLNRSSQPFVPLTAAQITLPGRPDLAPIRSPFVLVNRARLLITGAGVASCPPPSDG